MKTTNTSPAWFRLQSGRVLGVLIRPDSYDREEANISPTMVRVIWASFERVKAGRKVFAGTDLTPSQSDFLSQDIVWRVKPLP